MLTLIDVITHALDLLWGGFRTHGCVLALCLLQQLCQGQRSGVCLLAARLLQRRA